MNNDGAELVSQDLYGSKTAIKKKTPRLKKSTAIENQGATGFFLFLFLTSVTISLVLSASSKHSYRSD